MTDPVRSDIWTLAFARRDGTGGFLRLVRWPGVAWFWAYLVSPAWGLVVVRDHDVVPPRPGGPLVVRADGLWAELIPEQPGEHWSVGVEAFGVRLDDPLDAERGERGERLPVGLDLEWEVGVAPYGRVDGELLLGDDRAPFEGTGTFEHETHPDNPWAREWRRLSWQHGTSTGQTARDEQISLDVDATVLPTGARVDGIAFTAAAVAVVPTDPRLVLALLTGDAGWGWLEWCQHRPQPGRIAAP